MSLIHQDLELSYHHFWPVLFLVTICQSQIISEVPGGAAGALLSKDPPCLWPGAQLLCDLRCLCDGETFCSPDTILVNSPSTSCTMTFITRLKPWYTDYYTLKEACPGNRIRWGTRLYQNPWVRHSDLYHYLMRNKGHSLM